MSLRYVNIYICTYIHVWYVRSLPYYIDRKNYREVLPNKVTTRLVIRNEFSVARDDLRQSFHSTKGQLIDLTDTQQFLNLCQQGFG